MSEKKKFDVMPSASTAKLVAIMLALIALGCVNFLLLKELYTSYGAHNAFFVNQGVNLLYIVYGGLILYPRMLFTDSVTQQMRSLSKKRFVVMGCLDALGTFLTAMGAAFTPGSMQPLLNQTLIPWIILFSRVWLRKVYNAGEVSGAALIVFGACISALPPILIGDSSSDMRWYAVSLYALSNIPMALSTCYKEANFKEQELDVWYLTQWVSIVQFFVSFLLVPLLCLPGFGSSQGTALSKLPGQFYSGWLCCLQESEECKHKPTFWLLIGYCGVNVMYNTLGLYLVKVASALMNASSYAILLPCTTLLFFTPLAGVAEETFKPYNAFTAVGLVVVLVGFWQYQRYGRAVEIASLPEDLFHSLVSVSDDEGIPSLRKTQQSFQERIVGAGLEHGFGLDVAEVRQKYGTHRKLAQACSNTSDQHGHCLGESSHSH